MTSVSKNVYIDKLDDTVNVKSKHILTPVKKLIIKILNLKFLILLEYQNIKIFLQKVALQIGQKKF